MTSMKNYRLLIEYDGTRYSGWEAKEGRDTIQGKLEAVLERLCGQPVKVIGAGRTDAGVHARGMVANVHMEVPQEFWKKRESSAAHNLITKDKCDKADKNNAENYSENDTENEVFPLKIRDYMNRYLPEDICVREVSEVPEQFHARYNVVGKTYRYTCYYNDVKTIFDRKYVYSIGFQPDIGAMKKAAEYLTGEKDFAGFCGNARMKKSTVRRIDKIDIAQDGAYISFTYHGNGFLQYQIRIMTGTLLEVGKGSFSAEHVKEILEAKNRELAGPTLPAQGLCLMKIDY